MFFNLSATEIAIYVLLALVAGISHAYLRQHNKKKINLTGSTKDDKVVSSPNNTKQAQQKPREDESSSSSGFDFRAAVTGEKSSPKKKPAAAADSSNAEKQSAGDSNKRSSGPGAASKDLDACLDEAWDDLAVEEQRLDDAMADTLYKSAAASVTTKKSESKSKTSER